MATADLHPGRDEARARLEQPWHSSSASWPRRARELAPWPWAAAASRRRPDTCRCAGWASPRPAHAGSRRSSCTLLRDVAGQRGQARRRPAGWLSFLVAQRVADDLRGRRRRRRRRARRRRGPANTACACCGVCDEGRRRAVGHGAVQRIGGGRRADQDQHDQAHALLAVVAAVGEGDAGAGQDQQAADPQRRRRVGLRAPRRASCCGSTSFISEQQQRRERRSRTTGLNSSALNTLAAWPQSTPEVAWPARRHQLVGQADAHDRADQRVRRASWACPAPRCRGSR